MPLRFATDVSGYISRVREQIPNFFYESLFNFLKVGFHVTLLASSNGHHCQIECAATPKTLCQHLVNYLLYFTMLKITHGKII